ncbi:hypothetical protein [Agrococcus sp. ProA11]|uniref:hypothetical protein n=1 Tax=Agrococcus chionoecetis TaxID=3153752 RepID=UPI0032607646
MFELWIASTSAEPAGTDLWGVAIPAWVGAIGSILASAVAAWALIGERKTYKGLRQTVAPEQEGVPAPPIAPERATAASAEPGPDEETRRRLSQLDGWGDAGRAAPPVEPSMRRSALQIRRNDRRHFELVNVLDVSIAVLEIRQADAGEDVRLPRTLPAVLEPGEGLPLVVKRTLTSPAVIGLDVTYGTNDWSRRRRLFLD